MANPVAHSFDVLRSYGNDRYLISGQFLPAGSSTATTTNLLRVATAPYGGPRGIGFTVLHDPSATGQYNILLDQDPVDIISVGFDFSLSALPGSGPNMIQAPGTSIIPNANANIRAGTGTIFHFACTYIVGVTATDVPNNSLNTISFQAWCKYSTAGKVYGG